MPLAREPRRRLIDIDYEDLMVVQASISPLRDAADALLQPWRSSSTARYRFTPRKRGRTARCDLISHCKYPGDALNVAPSSTTRRR